MKRTRKLMIVAGEASGDAHAAKLVRAIIAAEPDTAFEFFGAAGPKMREASVEPVVQSDDLSIVGIFEIGRSLPMFFRVFTELKKAAVHENPDAVILVDFPDFNLRLAKSLKKRGFTIIYFISPQLWAWRKYRLSAMRKYVDLLLTVLPFEKEWYSDNGFERVEYVGNPLANEVHSSKSKYDFCLDNDLDSSEPIVSLLPGSRHKEIVRIMPIMLQSAYKIAGSKPEVQFVIAIGSGKNRLDVDKAVSEFSKIFTKLPETFKVVEGETYNALNASDAALVTSGTATLETGIIGTPLVIVYKTSTINYLLLKPLISVEHYGLINLIAGKRIAKELIQGDFNAETVSNEIFRLMLPDENALMREELRLATEKLGQGGASIRAAEAILKLINGSQQN